MKPARSRHAFDSKLREAAPARRTPTAADDPHRHEPSDWLTLIGLAVIWGGAFFCIHVAVRHVPPLTYVWLRVTIAAAALWAYLAWRRRAAGLPRTVWGSILLLALLNNVIPFILFGWGQTHIASGLASILNATTPIWGVIVAHVFTSDERMNPRKIAGVLLGFGGVALMIGPDLLGSIGNDVLAQLACVIAALLYALAGVWARRFKRQGVSPLSVTTGQLTASAIVMLPLSRSVRSPLGADLPAAQRSGSGARAGGDLQRLRLHSLLQADRFGRRDQCPAGHPAGAAGRDRDGRTDAWRGHRAARLRRPRASSPSALQRSTGGCSALSSGGGKFSEQLPSFLARPIEIADVAPHLFALGVKEDRRRQDLGIQRS